MKSDENTALSGTSLKWNRAEPASPAEMEDFWKKLRNYYRTGQKPKASNIKATSALLDLLNQEEDLYPYKLGDTNIELDNDTPYHFLKHLLHEHQRENRVAFKSKLKSLIDGLSDLLNIDNGSAKSTHLKETFDFANELIAFDKMVDIIPKSTGHSLNKSRLGILKEVIKNLHEGLNSYEEKEAIIIVPKDIKTALQRVSISANTNIIERKDDIFNYTKSLFIDHIQSFASLIKAHRIAQLETEGVYKEEIHDEYFESFSWHRFTAEELMLLQPIVVVVTNEYLINHLSSFSQLVATNQPVNIIVINEEYVTVPNPYINWEDASHQFRQEIAALTIAHRNVYTFQNCMDNPAVVYSGISQCLRATQPGVCHLAVPKVTEDTSHKVTTITRAQNAGRFFPEIVYSPGNTNKWEGRFDLTHNIQPENNWPKFTLKAKTPDDTEVMIDVSFTYADYKAIYAQKSQELMIIPPAFYTEHLVPLSDYLELEETKLYGKIPYIWLQDQNFELHRAAVPNVWVASCEERLDFWNFLQAIGTFQTIKPEEQPLQNLKSNDEAATKQLMAESSQDEAKREAVMLDKAVKKVLAVLLEDD